MKTLGVKFEVAGVGEAQASLNNLRQSINQSLAQSKKALEDSFKVSNQLIKKSSASNKVSVDKTKQNYFKFKAEIEQLFKNRQFSVSINNNSNNTNNLPAKAASPQTIYVKQQAKSLLEEVGKELFKEAVKTQARKIIASDPNKKESDTAKSSGRASLYKNSIRIRFTPEALKDLYGVINGKAAPPDQKSSKSLYRIRQDKGKGLIGKLIEPLTTRLDYITSGYFGAIGSHFGGQFAKGLDTVLDEELDISHERKGRIAGKTYAYFQNGKEENLSSKFEILKQAIVDLNDETQNVDAAQIKATIKAVMGIPNALIDSAMTGFRRSSLEIEGVRKTGADKAQFNEGETIENLGQYNQAIITASGFAGKQGTQGREQAQTLREINNQEDTAIFSSDTQFTDVLFEANNLASGAAWGVNAVANAAKINLKGFNPDAVEMVNKVLAMRSENPEIEVTLTGHSAGGFVVEEAQYLLELLEVEGTRAVTVGTPNLKGGVKPQNIQRIFGENDPLQAIHDAAEYLDFVSEGTEYDAVSEGHAFNQYIASENVRRAIFRRSGRNPNPTPPTPPTPDVPPTPDTPPPNRPNPAPSVLDRAALLGGELIVSILESEGDIAARAEIFRDIVLAGFNQAGEDLNNSALAFGETINNLVQDALGVLSTSALVVFDLESLDIEGIRAKFQELFRTALVVPLDRLLQDYRALAIRTVAAPAAQRRSTEILAANRRNSGARVDEDTNTLIMGIGGYGGLEGRGGISVTRDVQNNLEESDGTKVIWVGNPNSDIPPYDENDDQMRVGATVVGSALKPRVRGYSPDAVEGAAQALAAIERNPEIKIKIVGYSGGADIAAEIAQILNSLGHGDRVQAIGLGAPYAPGNLNPENYRPIIAEGDPVHSRTEMFGGETLPNSHIASHALREYLSSAEFQVFLNGSPEPLSPETSTMLQDTSEDFLTNYAYGLTAEQKRSDREYAVSTIEKIKQFIPVSEPEVVGQLETALANFERFLAVVGNDHVRVIQERELLNEGSDFLGEPNQNKQDAVALRDRLVRRQTAIRTVAQADGLDDDSFAVVDAQLSKTIEHLNNFIANYQEPKRFSAREDLVTAYQNHLKALQKENKNKFKNYKSREVIRDFKKLDTPGKEDFLKQTTSLIKLRQRQYLQAIESGQLDVAAKLGEELIEQTELVKQVYKNLAQSLDLDDPLVNVIRGNQGYITSIETEIIQGQPNLPGRISQGLPELVGQEFDLAQSGDEIAAGLIEEILKRLPDIQEVGANIGEELTEGTNESLQIESPSKVFERIGQFVVQGLGLGLENISDPLDEAREDLEEEIETIDVSGEPAEGGLLAKIKAFSEGILESFPLLNRFKGAILGVGAAIAGALGIGFAINNLQDLAKEALETAMAVEALNRSIVFVSRTPEMGLKNLEFISAAAKDISADLNVAKEAYAGFLGAAKNTALEGEQTDRIFTAFAGAAANRGLGAQSQGRLFTAIEQIISKRYLGAEEVRGQIGDVFAGFEGILSESLGVFSSQLSEMMSNRELRLDVLPKIAAALEVQNASVAGIQTAQMAQTKLNNALLEFKTLLGSILQPLQKFSLNALAEGIDWVTSNLNTLLKIARNAIGVVLIALYGQVNVLKIAFIALGKVINALIITFSNLWAAKLAILTTLGKLVVAYALVAAAIKAVTNLIDLSKNQYRELNDDVEKLTESMNRYSQAVKDANSQETPKIGWSDDLKLDEGWELPDNWFGNLLRPLVGGDRLNLDNLVRSRIGITTEAERRQADFQVAAGDLNFRTDQLLGNSQPATIAAKEIVELDRQIAEVQSERLELMPGDKEGLEASLAEERKINKVRDAQFKILANYQQSLQSAKASNEKALAELEAGYANQEFSRDVYDSTKASLLDRQDATADKLKQINNILSKLTKTLSVFQKELRNSNERIEGFIERRGLEANRERTQIIQTGLFEGKGEAVVQLELEASSRRELQDYVSQLNKTIAQGEKRLNSAALAEGYRLVRESAAANNLELDSSTIDRMLAEDERSKQEKDALGELKALKGYRNQLAQYQEQLAQNLKGNRTALLDFNRTISDYFFQITQQIKEATLETKRLLSQIFYTDIKNKLRGAIAPGSNTFVNGIIDNIQSVIDQAQQVAEKIFGDASADLGFESESRTLGTEMTDFIRQIGNAGDAVENFVKRLNGSSPSNPSSSSSPSSNLDALRRAIIGKESGANFKAVNPHSGALGYGQVMPANVASWTKQALGKSLTSQQFLNDADAQIKVINYKLGSYLKKELSQGFDLDTAVRRVASTWYSGRPNLYNNTRPQTYGAGSYPSIDSYTRDILRRFKVEGGGNNRPQLVSSSNNQPQNNSTIVDKALKVNRQLLQTKQQNLTISKRTTEQKKEALQLQVKQTIEANKRDIEQAQKENQRNVLDLESKFASFKSSYGYQSAETEAESSLRDIKQQFLDADLDTAGQIRNAEDAITTINKLILEGREIIAKLKARGTPEDLAAAKVAQAGLAQLQNSLTGLKTNLAKIQAIQEKSNKLQQQYTHFVREQNKLKIEQEKLTKDNALLDQRSNIVAARGTIEAERQLKLEQEKFRLELKINEIRQNTPPGVYRDELILNELEQGKINTENINSESISSELDLEKKLLDLDSGIGEKQAGFLARYGFNLQADKLRRQNAIAAENNRFQSELAQIKQDFAGQADLIAEFTQKARELNRVNLKGIDQQFKSLLTTVQDLGISAVQGFFSDFVTNFFDGAAQKEQGLQQERLRYAEELNQLNQQYKDEEGKLAHLKNRARELNEQKLDKINNEFNIFGRVVDLARQALLEFVKQLAVIAAQQAAAKFISGILGSAIGGIGGGGTLQVGNDFGGGIGTAAFTASDGITVGEEVPNYSRGDTIKSRKLPNRLTSYFKASPGVKKAFAAEGKGARLGVFHVGEELLSNKTGEAPVYQALKRKYGINPLQQLIPYFNEGGSVGQLDVSSNILSGLGASRPRIDLSGISQGRSQKSQSTRVVNLNQTVVTPNADSFNLNQDQRNQDLLESLRRSL